MEDTKDFEDMVRKGVAAALEEKEGAARTEKMEDVIKAAQQTIDDLTGSLSEKEQLVEAANDEKQKLADEIKTLRETLEELETNLRLKEEENTQLGERALKAESALEEITLARIAEERMSELAEAKVAKTGEKLEAQKAKVKSMSDAEFASYKEELVELRTSIEEELAKEEAAADEGDLAVAPADIAAARSESASVTLDAESASKSTEDRFARFSAYLDKKLSNTSR